MRCYPEQERRFADKQRNVELALASIDGLTIQPGETWSFWRSVGRPTRAAGYAPAAALKDGLLVEDIGGAICLASTLLYNAGLLSGMTIVERYCHSVDTYGSDRYFELGRDASVEFAYRDLRLANPFDAPLMIRCGVRDTTVSVEVCANRDPRISASIVVSEPSIIPTPIVTPPNGRLPAGAPIADRAGCDSVRVAAWRLLTIAGATVRQPLGESVYGAPPRRGWRGRASASARVLPALARRSNIEGAAVRDRSNGSMGSVRVLVASMPRALRGLPLPVPILV